MEEGGSDLACSPSASHLLTAAIFSTVVRRRSQPTAKSPSTLLSRRLFLLWFPERRLETAEGVAAVSPDISNMGLRASRLPPDPECYLEKTENWNEKHPELCAELEMRLRWRGYSAWWRIDADMMTGTKVKKLIWLENRNVMRTMWNQDLIILLKNVQCFVKYCASVMLNLNAFPWNSNWGFFSGAWRNRIPLTFFQNL